MINENFPHAIWESSGPESKVFIPAALDKAAGMKTLDSGPELSQKAWGKFSLIIIHYSKNSPPPLATKCKEFNRW